MLCAVIFILAGCTKSDLISDALNDVKISQTRATPTLYFDWEHIDWMPTPPGQSLIPVPWVGQGSIASTYGLDVVNDRVAADGWELLYSTFNPNAPGQLVNPYFILYNKYRGIMRIFLYITTPFVTQSSYVQDALAIVSNHTTSMLSFLGRDWIDATAESPVVYEQMQPTPTDGSLPLAANKWYMMQYEIAYDPNITNIPYNEIQFSWRLNYYEVDKINLGGSIVGELQGIIGATKSNFFAPLKNATTEAFQVIGTGAFSVVGKDFILNHATNVETGANSLGLKPAVFKDLYNGISSALKSSVSNLPSAIMKILSATLGGGGSSTKPISLSLKADISLKGDATSYGSIPSSPTSMWVPGTNIPDDAVGIVPLYNKPLGILSFVGKPKIEIPVDMWLENRPDPFDPDHGGFVVECQVAHMPQNIDYSEYLQINPAVLEVADVTIIKQDLVITGIDWDKAKTDIIDVNPSAYHYEWGGDYQFALMYPKEMKFHVRFCVKVTPKNGAPESVIVKTFQLDDIWSVPHYG